MLSGIIPEQLQIIDSELQNSSFSDGAAALEAAGS